jgi:hypothetical protein
MKKERLRVYSRPFHLEKIFSGRFTIKENQRSVRLAVAAKKKRHCAHFRSHPAVIFATVSTPPVCILECHTLARQKWIYHMPLHSMGRIIWFLIPFWKRGSGARAGGHHTVFIFHLPFTCIRGYRSNVHPCSNWWLWFRSTLIYRWQVWLCDTHQDQ